MITLTLKILLQITTVLCFGYLSIAFFQKLFCRDIGTIDYHKFIHDRKMIWTRFKKAFKSPKYRSFILLCILCLFGFSNCIHELSADWRLENKLIGWQIWSIVFCYAIYLSQSNMKLKLFYDLSGTPPTKTKYIPMETKSATQIKQQVTKQLDNVVRYKTAIKYLIGILIVAILCSAYSFYAMRKAEYEVNKHRQYSASRDSIISGNQRFQDSINVVLNTVQREKDSLLIIKTAKMLEREDVLNKPIDYHNTEERKQILEELLKEDHR